MKTKQVRIRNILTLALLAVSVPRAAAPEAEISGLVTDASRAVVAQALVRLVSQGNGTSRTTRTNDRGAYMLASIQPGIYDLEISKEGFRPISRVGIKLEQTACVRLNFVLQAGSSKEAEEQE